DRDRNALYVADPGNNRIRQLSPDGVVSTLAGSGARGGQDGPADQASFDEPVGIIIENGSRRLHVKEAGGRLRTVSPDGTVTTDTDKAFLGWLASVERARLRSTPRNADNGVPLSCCQLLERTRPSADPLEGELEVAAQPVPPNGKRTRPRETGK